ncbi:MAG: dihydrodipicolinate synthase family protein, partial [Candidatus Dormibacteraceae bacterium]
MEDAMTTTERLDQALHGVIPPLITPLNEDGTLDESSFRTQLRRCLDAGCSGVFVSGSTGEGPWLTAEQRRRAVELAVESETVVLAGVMLPGTSMTREAAVDAAQAGADAVVVSAPYYFGADDRTIVQHVESIAASVDRTIVLYNIPQLTHNPMSAPVVQELAGNPAVIGIKDSSGDMDLFRAHLRVAEQTSSFRVLQGAHSEMRASLLLGAHGLVPGLANVFPALFVGLLNAVREQDEARGTAVQHHIGA